MLETLLSNAPPPATYLFIVFAAITVFGACGVAFLRNIVYSAFCLLATFAGMVGLFAFLSADFLAVVQLMVYVGGILVLILFAVMLTSRISDVKRSNPSTHRLVGAVMLVTTVGLLSVAMLGYRWPVREPAQYESTAEKMGKALLGPYLLPFEVAGFLLLAALLAAVVVARKEIKEDEEDEDAPRESTTGTSSTVGGAP